MALGCEALAFGLLASVHHTAAQMVILLGVLGAGHGGTLACEYVILTRPVPSAEVGAVVGLASAGAGVSGAIATAVTAVLLTSRLVSAGTTELPAAAGYATAWRCAAAVAAAGAVAVAASAYAARNRTHQRATAGEFTDSR